MRRLAIFALALCSALSTQHSALLHAQVITTVAGGDWVFRGDGGRATDSPLGEIRGVAVDSLGNLFAVDASNNIVVKISTNGILTIAAGNGIRGFSGDGGSATSASLNLFPFYQCVGVTVDGLGNLYIADNLNGRVRKVTSGGIITTVALVTTPTGVAVDSTGNVYVAGGARRVYRVNTSGVVTAVAGTGVYGFSGDGGPATAASFYDLSGLAIDSAGNLYVSDKIAKRVRKVGIDGTVNTVAGNGRDLGPSGDGGPATAAVVSWPTGLTVDGNGNLYIADRFNIRKVGPGGIIASVAGTGRDSFSGDGGPAAGAALNFPSAVAADTVSNLYIADSKNFRVRKVNVSGMIGTVAGNGLFRFAGDGEPAINASLNIPTGVAIDAAGNIYIIDQNNHRIRKVGSDGRISTVAGNGIPGFAGDGGLATSASLALGDLMTGTGLVMDEAGNLYIADAMNDRIRKVSRNGTISTIAGGGNNYPGDSGPATNAWLLRPSGVAVSTAGDVYIADYFSQRVRKVTPNGTITTVAGSGAQGFSGDGGPATSAQLNGVADVALSVRGDVYIADQRNHRIRKMGPNGIIITVAGNGIAGSSGDGGLATSASLNWPSSVAVDAGGNLYIGTESPDGVGNIRKITPDGVITSAAGSSRYGFSGDGGLATAAQLARPERVAVDPANNLYISDTDNNRIRKVLALAPAVSVAPTHLRFSAASGSPAVGAQQVGVTSAVTGLGWSAQAAAESGGNWLSVSPASGTMPATVSVTVNGANLAPQTYRGTVTIQAPLAAPPVQTVTVELTVTPAPKPQLVVEPGSLIFEALAGGDAPGSQTLRITNSGEGTLDWTAKVEALGGGSWLSLGSNSGAVSATSSANAPISISLAGLRPGIYSSLITIESQRAQQSQTLEATLLVSQTSKRLLMSRAGMSFTGIERRGTVRQSVAVFNTGQGMMDWTATASTLSGGNWLTATPTGGRSDAASLTSPQIDVAVNFAALTEGGYSGLIKIEAPGARDSPQYVTVDVTVLPPGGQLGTQVRPTGLIFTALAGTSSASSQLLRLTTARSEPSEARSGILTFDGGDWIEILPRNLMISADDPRTVVVQPSLGSKAPGAYRGQLTFLFDDGNTQVVDILFLVVRPGGSAAAESPGAPGELTPTAYSLQPAASSCTPQRLHAVHRTLSNNVSAPVGWPTPIEVQVADDCGNAVTNATVVASFTNGDSPLTLASQRDGTYTRTWRPGNAAKQVTVTVRANLPPLQPAELSASGEVPESTDAPVLFGGGIVNGASFTKGASVAPGTIISVFGRRMAQGLNNASSLPLARSLGGASLKIGDIDAPLFFSSDGQINAQIPFELTPGTRPQALLKARLTGGTETVAVPETITIVPARPGIFTTTQDGKGQGVIMDAGNVLVDSANPAKAGDVLVVYCTGLGATNPAVRSGEAATASPLAKVTTPVTVTIGGQPATVQYAGLTPNFVGLYQVNLQIPTGLTPSPATPLVLSQDGVPSNAVTLGVR